VWGDIRQGWGKGRVRKGRQCQEDMLLRSHYCWRRCGQHADTCDPSGNLYLCPCPCLQLGWLGCVLLLASDIPAPAAVEKT
jgi:hypothetical protein